MGEFFNEASRPAGRTHPRVETGGCPHTAIREDISSNLLALEELHKNLNRRFYSSNQAGTTLRRALAGSWRIIPFK